jgi:hypothetical protein
MTAKAVATLTAANICLVFIVALLVAAAQCAAFTD